MSDVRLIIEDKKFRLVSAEYLATYEEILDIHDSTKIKDRLMLSSVGATYHTSLNCEKNARR